MIGSQAALLQGVSSQYGWNDKAARYYNITSGRFVSQSEVSAAMADDLDSLVTDGIGISNELQKGEINLSQWQAEMMGLVKTAHIIEAVGAAGGWRQMTQSDWGWVGKQIQTQYGYLRNFANDVATGKQPLNGRFLQRVQMYFKAARATFQQMRRRLMKAKGMQRERRVLGQAEHCQTKEGLLGCLELAAMGWRPIGTLPPIGMTPCMVGCQCHYEFMDDQGKIYQ